MAKEPTTIAQFRRWLKAEIDWLQEMEGHPDPVDRDDLDTILDDARAIAVRLGLPLVAESCMGHRKMSLLKCQQVLATCLAGLDSSGPLTVQQAAECLNISPRKVYDLCSKGLLRHTANPIRIRPDDLEAYQSKQRRSLRW